MVSLRVVVILLLVAGAVLLAAGCVGQPESDEMGTGNGVNLTTVISTRPLINPQECPRPVSLENFHYSQWITLNHGNDHYAGDTFAITGTVQRKNESEDFENISILIERFGPHTGQGPQMVFEGIVDRYTGDCLVKTWSAPVQLSEQLASGTYDVIVETPEQSLSYTFNISKRLDQSSCTPPINTTPFIAIDPIKDKSSGEIITITAKTNLPVGEKVHVAIAQSQHSCPKAGCDYENLDENVTVVRGEDCLNSTTYLFNTTGHTPYIYIVEEYPYRKNIGSYREFNIIATR